VCYKRIHIRTDQITDDRCICNVFALPDHQQLLTHLELLQVFRSICFRICCHLSLQTCRDILFQFFIIHSLYIHSIRYLFQNDRNQIRIKAVLIICEALFQKRISIDDVFRNLFTVCLIKQESCIVLIYMLHTHCLCLLNCFIQGQCCISLQLFLICLFRCCFFRCCLFCRRLLLCLLFLSLLHSLFRCRLCFFRCCCFLCSFLYRFILCLYCFLFAFFFFRCFLCRSFFRCRLFLSLRFCFCRLLFLSLFCSFCCTCSQLHSFLCFDFLWCRCCSQLFCFLRSRDFFNLFRC